MPKNDRVIVLDIISLLCSATRVNYIPPSVQSIAHFRLDDNDILYSPTLTRRKEVQCQEVRA